MASQNAAGGTAGWTGGAPAASEARDIVVPRSGSFTGGTCKAGASRLGGAQRDARGNRRPPSQQHTRSRPPALTQRPSRPARAKLETGKSLTRDHFRGRLYGLTNVRPRFPRELQRPAPRGPLLSPRRRDNHLRAELQAPRGVGDLSPPGRILRTSRVTAGAPICGRRRRAKAALGVDLPDEKRSTGPRGAGCASRRAHGSAAAAGTENEPVCCGNWPSPAPCRPAISVEKRRGEKAGVRRGVPL